MIYSSFTSLKSFFQLVIKTLISKFQNKKGKLLFEKMGGHGEPIENSNSFLCIPFDILSVRF